MRGSRFAVCFLFLVGCADLEVGDRASEITGGSPEAGYPAVFALAYNGQGGCTGTCITDTVGLTAAHCVEGEPASVLSALFGASEATPETTIQVTEVVIEPSFNTANRGGDIALLRFAEACPAVIPANRKPLEPLVGEPVVMVGFGVTVETANDAGIKRSGVATLFSVTPSEVGGMHEGELATSNDPHGTCDGDSGGPTFMTIDGAEVVVGVTSRGSTDASGNDEPCGQGRSVATRPDSFGELIDAFVGTDPNDEDPNDDDPNDDDPNDEDPNDDGPDGGTTPGGCSAGGSTSSPLLLAALLLLLWRRRQAPLSAQRLRHDRR